MSRRNKSKTAATPQAAGSAAFPARAQARAAQIGRSSGAESAIAMVVATPQGPRRVTATSREVESAVGAAIWV